MKYLSLAERPVHQTAINDYNDQNSMVVAQKQKYPLMEKDRKSTDKTLHL